MRDVDCAATQVTIDGDVMIRVHGHGGGGARGRRLAWRAGVVAAAAIALAVFLAGGAGAAAAKKPNPSPCARQLGIGAPAVMRTGTTPLSVLASYAVLRRPQVPSDIPPASAGLSALLSGRLASYDPFATRLLSRSIAGSVYLAVGVAPRGRIALSTACRRAGEAALVRLLNVERTVEGSGPAYALIEIPSVAGPGSNGSATATPVTSFAAAGEGFSYGVSGLSHPIGSGFITLVPDGVGAVRFSYAPSVGSFTLPVQANLGQGAGPAIDAAPLLRTAAEQRRFVNEFLPLTVTWLTAPGGASVREFARPAGLVDEYIAELHLEVEIAKTVTVSKPTG